MFSIQACSTAFASRTGIRHPALGFGTTRWVQKSCRAPRSNQTRFRIITGEEWMYATMCHYSLTIRSRSWAAHRILKVLKVVSSIGISILLK
jgi:hypothetical protein